MSGGGSLALSRKFHHPWAFGVGADFDVHFLNMRSLRLRVGPPNFAYCLGERFIKLVAQCRKAVGVRDRAVARDARRFVAFIRGTVIGLNVVAPMSERAVPPSVGN